MTRDELRLVAQEKLDDGLLLLDNGRWSNAYYLLGYAVEIALKAIIATRFSADEIPDRNFVNRVYTHDLASLVSLADLASELETLKEDAAFAANWAVVANWNESRRYSRVDEADALAMANAVRSQNGIFPWLIQRL